jgi:hypothetical protein
MLILCYGITKSGSTLAFELVKGMLESVGHPQSRLPDGPIDPGRRLNYIEMIDGPKVEELLAAIGPRHIAVKTHTAFKNELFPLLEKLQDQRRLQIVASYRDPRDICLALMDAGALARERNLRAFSMVEDMASAVAKIRQQIPKFRKWSSVAGTLRLNYETVAFAPDDAITAIEGKLDISCDREAAKKHAFEDAFTQKNKARRRRYEDELTESQNSELQEIFGPFIRNVCEGENEDWFASNRERILAKIGEGELES